MNFRDYCAIEAVNWSSLKLLCAETGGSPLLYKYHQEHPTPDKPAFQLGRAAHAAVLEPDSFASQYVVYPGKVRRGKQWEAFQEDHADAEIVTAADYSLSEAMAQAVHAHPVAAPLVKGGKSEVTAEWVDPVTGRECKARIDHRLPIQIADLKTAREIDPRNFCRAASRYLYYGQMAFYHDGAVLAGMIPEDAKLPAIVAVQSSPPHDVGVFSVGQAAIEAGRKLYRGLLDRLNDCIVADDWPGAAPGVQELELPHWAPGMDDDGTSTINWE